MHDDFIHDGSVSSIKDLLKLSIIAEINSLKARYFRCVDTKDWDGFATLFTPDAQFDISADVPGLILTGPDSIVEAVSPSVIHAVTVHHGHCPEIQVCSALEAKAIWAMEDRIVWNEKAVNIPFASLHGFGHYHETYQCLDGQWKIKSLKLTRLMVERVPRSQ